MMENNISTESVRVFSADYFVSNDTRKTGLNNNDLILGPSGAGKTGGYVIPNIMQAQESIVIADTKRNLSRKLGYALRQKGFDIYTIDLVNPEKSTPYNPLEYISIDERTGNLREQDIMTISNAIMDFSTPDDPFWEYSSKGVVACLVSYVKEAYPKDKQNLGSVVEVYKQLSAAVGSSTRRVGDSNVPVVPFLEEWTEKHPDSFAGKKYMMFRSVLAAERTWGCIAQYVSSALNIFDFREARRLFCENSDFLLQDLGRRKIALFLNISDTDRTFDKINNLFYTQVIQALCREADKNPDSRLAVPVRIIMDDFATNTRVPDFDKIISVIRSREISVSLILQNLTQLNTMYQDAAAATIVSNCDHILYLGGNDLNTARYISCFADVPVQRILCMPLDKAYIIERGKKAQLCDKIRPYSIEIPVGDTEEDVMTPDKWGEFEEFIDKEFDFGDDSSDDAFEDPLDDDDISVDDVIDDDLLTFSDDSNDDDDPLFDPDNLDSLFDDDGVPF